MITAKEARLKTEQARLNWDNTIMNRIEHEIESGIKDRMSSVEIRGNIPDKIVDELVENGYSVTWWNGLYGIIYDISWYKDEELEEDIDD